MTIDELRNAVEEQIKTDIQNGDTTVLAELLKSVTVSDLKNSLPEEEWAKYETTHEICPHCDNEVEIMAHEPTHCSECDKVILPCSTCKVVDNCDWNEDTRCSQYPK